ncbi:unnamed protein product, partial [Mesorhabditis belari]|uniref:EF-hand domain-containing protein n=1 Tax=Mesorhabditis belari TaxID=2138241 RepID=A0AAF3F4S4_9BILA
MEHYFLLEKPGRGRQDSMFAGKNAIITVGSEKGRRRQSQFQIERALHRFYGDPGVLSRNPTVNRLLLRLYWSIRSLQFHCLYKDEVTELAGEDLSDMRWEVGVHPLSLDVLTQTTGFDRRWIKYMYGRFKNECPTGRMKESEFKKIFSCIVAPEKASDQYLGRLFKAFSSGTDDNNMITFNSLLKSLSFLSPQTSQVNAEWTIRIITGDADKQFFNFAEFHQFTQTIFALQEGKIQVIDGRGDRETVEQRARAVFKELDTDHDGIVRAEDMQQFFETIDFFSAPQNEVYHRMNSL